MKIPAPDICRVAGGRKKGETEITDPGEATRIEQVWLKRNLKIPAFAGMTERGMAEIKDKRKPARIELGRQEGNLKIPAFAGMTEGGSRMTERGSRHNRM